MPTLRTICDLEAPMPWQRALEIARALALHRAVGRPALFAEAIWIDGNQVHVPVVKEPPPVEHAGDDHGWVRTAADQMVKNMKDRQDAVTWPLDYVAYYSPEQLMGKELREPSHVYSIGVITYELLTKRVPFAEAKGPAGLITAQLKTEPMAPSAHAAVPRAVDELVLRCLRKKPNERFESLDALARAIDDLFD